MCEYIKTQFPAHLSLHEHQRPGVHRGAARRAGALGHRRSDVLDRRRVAGELRQLPAARQVRHGDPQPARHGGDEKRARRDVPFINWRYILFKWNDSDEEMARAAAGAAIGVDRLCWEITDHPESSFLAAVRAGLADLEAIRTRSGTTTISGNAIPARRRARDRRRTLVPAGRWPRQDPAGRSAVRHACTTCRPPPFPRRPPTAAGWSGSARSSATSGAPSSSATTRAPGCRRRSRRRATRRRPHRDPRTGRSRAVTR